jgi:AmmeMemoRadiSam system protein B
MHVRLPAVADRFYPGDRAALRPAVAAYVDGARSALAAADVTAPKAIIGPHAGFMYSGPIAGSAYASVAPGRGVVERVVLIGPAHRVPIDGLALPSADVLLTPIGPIEVDLAARDVAMSCAAVAIDDHAHAQEHSVEVHLPFIQHVLGSDVRVVPIVVGRAAPQTVAAVLAALWGGPETLIVVSSDLSHYEPYAVARSHDRRTANAIVNGDIDEIGPYDACGAFPIRGLLAEARRHDLDATLLDLRNSGDTAGPTDRVVGYGAFAFTRRARRT